MPWGGAAQFLFAFKLSEGAREIQVGLRTLLRRSRIALSGAAIAISFQDGRARIERGHVRQDLLAALTEIASKDGAGLGLILAFRQGVGFRLEFSKELPESIQQPIRNVWGILCR